MCKCPKCNSKSINLYDCFDTETDCNDNIIEWWSGDCEDCQTDLIIKRVYMLINEEVSLN